MAKKNEAIEEKELETKEAATVKEKKTSAKSSRSVMRSSQTAFWKRCAPVMRRREIWKFDSAAAGSHDRP